MGKAPISPTEAQKIIYLRQRGYSLPEISREVGCGRATAFRYAKNVEILPEFIKTLKAKQGGSIARSSRLWANARNKAGALLHGFGDKEKLLVLASIYWAEGAKRDLSFINSDPAMVRVFVDGLLLLGVKKEEIILSLRIFDDLSAVNAKKFWSRTLDFPQSKIKYVSVLLGKKKGRLRYGMCRVRVVKGGDYFKLIISMIDLLKSEMMPAAVVQWIGRGFPKP